MSGSASQVWTPLALVSWTADYFRQHGVPSPRLDAELLLGHALELSRLALYLDFDRPVTEPERARFRELVRRRARDRTPVAYLTGHREFYARSFRVTPDVLIPRPETETLVQAALDLAPQRVADIGVGSGAVIGTLACELPVAELVGVDASPAALEVAATNLEQLGVRERVELLCGDGAAPLSGAFDVLVCNPPYVPSAELDTLAPELRHEPRIALDGGPDGLDFLRRLIPAAVPRLARGHLLLEVGAGQAEAVRTLLDLAGAKEIATHVDLAGIERVVEARFELES